MRRTVDDTHVWDEEETAAYEAMMRRLYPTPKPKRFRRFGWRLWVRFRGKWYGTP